MRKRVRDIVKNESCVKLVTSYYAEDKDVLIHGKLRDSVSSETPY